MIKDALPLGCWAAEDLPSNKGENIGYNELTNVELLSILIGSGTEGRNAVDTARALLFKCNNNLKTLAQMRSDEISSIAGIGKQKTARIQAFIELSKRFGKERQESRSRICSATDAYNYFYYNLAHLEHEEFWVAYLNAGFDVIKRKRISQGGLMEVSVDVRVVMREAVLCNAVMMVVAHNHPSGNLRPSKYDDTLTVSLKQACDTMRIRLNDHVIITDGNYYSYHENGKI